MSALLTRQQVRVLSLWADGLHLKGIAQRLKLSEKTVQFHWAEACRVAGSKHPMDLIKLMIPKPPELRPGTQAWYNRELSRLICPWL